MLDLDSTRLSGFPRLGWPNPAGIRRWPGTVPFEVHRAIELPAESSGLGLTCFQPGADPAWVSPMAAGETWAG